ncbi:MAG: type II secretion system F family protein [Sterolibacterium sp.]|nr:type II secretion system F family protein [Sterolibacterium sp.]
MANFAYRGRDANGQSASGHIDAGSPAEAAGLLQARGIIPTSITAHSTASRARPASARSATTAENKTAGGTGLNKDLLPKPVDSTDVMLFSRQIYGLLKAGVPIMRALAGLQESASKPSVIDMLQELRESLDAGRELSTALARLPKIFTPFYVAMVRVGEMTGQLETVFLRLYDHMAFERFMKEQVSSATRYPTFVIIAMAVALVVVNVFVIPAFSKVFAGFHAELPLMTKILLGFSSFMVDTWYLLLGGVVGVVLGFKAWIRTVPGRYQWDKLKLTLPIAGKIISKATLARFARSYALASKSGVPIIQALTTVSQTVGNEYIADKIENMRDGISRGETVLRVAAHAGIFPPVVLQMIAVGEESGTLDDLMQEIADMFQSEIEYDLKTLAQQIEPILITMLGIMVLVLALGIFLPLWDMGSVVKKK